MCTQEQCFLLREHLFTERNQIDFFVLPTLKVYATKKEFTPSSTGQEIAPKGSTCFPCRKDSLMEGNKCAMKANMKSQKFSFLLKIKENAANVSSLLDVKVYVSLKEINNQFIRTRIL